MKSKLLFALQLANVVLIVFMLGVSIAELVSHILDGKKHTYIKL